MEWTAVSLDCLGKFILDYADLLMLPVGLCPTLRDLIAVICDVILQCSYEILYI